MLVLSRREQEKFVFPTLGITISVMRVRGKCVQMGIDAPRSVPVVRSELLDGDTGAADPERPREMLLSAARRRLSLAQQQLQARDYAAAEESLVRALMQLERLEGGPPRPQRRALIVEDNPIESRLLSAYLELAGFDVVVVDDGFEALQYLAHEPCPDVMLLDMQMPRLNGERTVVSVRCEPRLAALKVFVVSGTERSETSLTLGSQGVDRWFSKPINPRHLVAEIDAVLDAELSA